MYRLLSQNWNLSNSNFFPDFMKWLIFPQIPPLFALLLHPFTRNLKKHHHYHFTTFFSLLWIDLKGAKRDWVKHKIHFANYNRRWKMIFVIILFFLLFLLFCSFVTIKQLSGVKVKERISKDVKEIRNQEAKYCWINSEATGNFVFFSQLSELTMEGAEWVANAKKQKRNCNIWKGRLGTRMGRWRRFSSVRNEHILWHWYLRKTCTRVGKFFCRP